jgi:hypothetical protein
MPIIPAAQNKELVLTNMVWDKHVHKKHGSGRFRDRKPCPSSAYLVVSLLTKYTFGYVFSFAKKIVP